MSVGAPIGVAMFGGPLDGKVITVAQEDLKDGAKWVYPVRKRSSGIGCFFLKEGEDLPPPPLDVPFYKVMYELTLINEYWFLMFRGKVEE